MERKSSGRSTVSTFSSILKRVLRRKNGRTDGHSNILLLLGFFYCFLCVILPYKAVRFVSTDKHTDRHTHTHTQTHEYTHTKNPEKQTDRQTQAGLMIIHIYTFQNLPYIPVLQVLKTLIPSIQIEYL